MQLTTSWHERYVETEERKKKSFYFYISMSIFCFAFFFSSIPVYVLPSSAYLIYVIKHLQYFNIQLMLNYWFLTNGQLLDFICASCRFSCQLSCQVIVKY